MKDFLKYTLATCTGMVLTGIVFLALGITILAGVLTAATSDSPVTLHDNSVMVIRLHGSLTEQKKDDPWSLLFGEEIQNQALTDILKAIHQAQETPEITGIHLDAGTLSATPAALQEIRQALEEFKTSGKPITAYGDTYSQGNYYVCSIADRLILNPQGLVTWMGLSSESFYYKELLDKLGIKMEIFKAGTYKSAVEPYTSTQMSEANREQITVFLSSTWNQIVQSVSRSRNIPADSLHLLADRLIALAPAEDLLRNKLVDTLLYREEAEEYILHYKNTSKTKRQQTTPGDVCKASPASKQTKEIAVYYAEGGIDDSSSSQESGIHAPKVCKDLRKLAEDEQIAAVVLRINSPGGSAFGSEQIWHEVQKLKEKKPVIVSMGGYAASGGYYIACGADHIIAEPMTLTGSIGIFGMIPKFKGLADKIGIHSETVKTNRHADFNSLTQPFDTESKAQMQAYIERGYNLFVQRCADGRSLSCDSIKQLAEGRVWTGEDAYQRGLVDELGGLYAAIEAAAQKAQLTDYTVADYPEEEDWLTQILNRQLDGWAATTLQEMAGKDYEMLRFMKQIRDQHPVQARLPFFIDINL